MTAPPKRVPKKRSAAWRRSMQNARQQAIGMLEQIGPNADHLPEEARKTEHRNLTAKLERVVQVIDQHLSDARPERRPRPRTPSASGARGKSR